MTIQNIEDVMYRIMSLNRNLTEESLTTLLSASGWDKDDIKEGLRIFSNSKDVFAKSMSSINFNSNSNQNQIKNQSQDSNIQSEQDLNSNNINNTDSNIRIETGNFENKIPIKIENENLGNEIKENKESINVNANDINHNTINTIAENKNKKSHFFIFIFIILLLIFVGIYVYFSHLQKSSNKNNLINEHKQDQNIQNQYVDTNQREVPSINSSNNNADANKNNINQNNGNNNQNNDIKFLREQIISLQKQISNIENKIIEIEKNKTTGSIKYISGSRGAKGVGISKVETSEKGFVIHYTNGKIQNVPFSTTTVLQIINAQKLCLNSTTTNSMTTNQNNNLNISCLDQETLQKLLLK